MDKAVQELLELEEDMWRANREGDGSFYDRVLREDALVVSRYGVAGKDRIVPMVQENRNPFTRSELCDQVVKILGDGTGLITYRCRYTALMDDTGAEQNFEVLATSVYVREGDTWKSVFHQQSAL